MQNYNKISNETTNISVAVKLQNDSCCRGAGLGLGAYGGTVCEAGVGELSKEARQCSLRSGVLMQLSRSVVSCSSEVDAAQSRGRCTKVLQCQNV